MQLPECFKQFARRREPQAVSAGENINFAVCPDAGSPFVHLMIAVKAGVRYEDSSRWGASHFLEHVLMRGTEKYSTLWELARRAEGDGGMASAYSTRDLTAYWMKMPAGREEAGLDILNQVLFHPTLKDEYIEAERSIIVHERRREESDYASYVSNNVESLLLAPNPMSRHPVGRDSDLAKMDSAFLRRCLNDWYHLGNMSFIAVGNVAPDFRNKLERFFGGAPVKEAVKPANFLVKAEYPDGSVIVKKSPQKNQIVISMGWRFPVFSFEDLLTWRVINTLLGSGYTSLLNLELREKHSLTYICNTVMNVYDGMGIFKMYMAMHEDDLPKVLQMTDGILADMGGSGLTDTLFSEAVMRHASALIARMESPFETSRLLAHSLSRDGELFSASHYLEVLEGISKERASELIKRWLDPADRLVFVCSGSDKVEHMFPKTYVI